MKTKTLLCWISVSLFLFSCKKNKTSNYEEIVQLSEFVTGFTQHLSRSTGTVEIKLSKAVVSHDLNIPLESDILKIKPSVSGEAILTDPYTLVFVPEKKFKTNSKYHFKLNLEKLFPDEKVHNPVFPFWVYVDPITFSVEIDEVSDSQIEAGFYEITGHITTSDIVEANQVRKVLKAKQGNKSLQVDIEQAENGDLFDYTITGIKRMNDLSSVEIQWNGKPIDALGNGNEIIPVPAINSNNVLRVIVKSEPEQLIEVNFSEALSPNQNLSGLVVIDTFDQSIRTSIDGNLLRIYTPQRLKGELLLHLFEGIRFANGNVFGGTSETLEFKTLSPAIKAVSNGNILPFSDEVSYKFQAVSLKAVDVRVVKIFQNNVVSFLMNRDFSDTYDLKYFGRPVATQTFVIPTLNNDDWKTYSLDIKPLIESDPGAIYQIQISFKPEYGISDCSNDQVEILPALQINSEPSANNSYWDENYSYDDNYWNWIVYDWDQTENPCHPAYYNHDRFILQNILSTNLGLISKESDNGEVHVFATDLISGNPVSGAEVNFYSLQKQLLHTGKSDQNGLVQYDSRTKVKFVEASNGKDKAYLNLNDQNALQTSQFEVEGHRTQKGLLGYIYGERGVWRPGDTVHVCFVLNDRYNPIPEEHPVVYTLSNPSGVKVDKKISTNSSDGFYCFSTVTDPEDITGNYLAKIEVGGVSFTKNIPIETIKPNRLKINLDVHQSNVDLSAKWLHGAPAPGLKATVDLTLRQKETSFPSFAGYVFDDPVFTFAQEENRIFEGNLDEQGRATFSNRLNEEMTAPGMLRAIYVTNVYEKGGNSSIDAYATDYSPYSSYVGIKVPESNNYYRQLDTDVNHNFQVASVDENGNPISLEDLEVKVYQVSFRWWWNRSDNDLSSYVTGEANNEIFSTTVRTNSAGKASFNFKVDYPNWGRYLVRVYNPNSGHYAGSTVYIDWPSWRGRSQKGGDAASILAFTTNKSDYKVGENIDLSFPSSQGGRALVTVENGSQILQSFWVEPKKEFTNVKIPVTKEMSPNAYVSVHYMQPYNQSDNDLPIRLYGINSITIYDGNTKLEPKINAPAELSPEEDYQVTVSENNKREMTYTLAVVDDGLLDLTRFKTPNAWEEFYKKQALGVKTWDLYDYVIGAYSGRIDQVYSLGGDEEAQAAEAKKAQRFQPVVKFLGPFILKPGQKNTHNLKMPNYVGSVRIMVVAGNRREFAYGNVEKTIPVKKPLMVLGTLPRKISPQETIRLPISIFAMENKIKNVSIQVKTNELLEVIGQNSTNLEFQNPGEKEAYFTLKTGASTGIAKVEITATSGNEVATYAAEIDLYNPNQAETSLVKKVLQPNSEIRIPINQNTSPNIISNIVEVASLPDLNMASRLQYLIRYPHGCAEQTTSAAFPQLFLSDIADLDASQIESTEFNVKQAIQKIKVLQRSDGGFAYWPSNSHSDEYVSSYLGNFLIEAEKKGYALPADMLDRWIKYQKSSSYSHRNNQYEQVKEAYRLYTLALAGSPQISDMNRLRENSDLHKMPGIILASSYALVGQRKTAETLLNQSRTNPWDDDYDDRFGSYLRNASFVLESYVLLDKQIEAQEVANQISKELSSGNWYSTQSISMALKSISKFAKMQGGKGIDITYTIDGKSNSVSTSKSLKEINLSKNSSGEIVIKNRKDNTVYVHFVQTYIPEIGNENAEERDLKLISRYFGLDGQKVDISSLPLTSDFVAAMTVENKTDAKVRDVALTQMIPSGWEIINTRYTELGDNNNAHADYIDIRDDRINYYFDLDPNESKQFQILLKASFLGKYYLPGSIAEAMYDNNYYAKNEGTWIEIVE